MSKQHSLWQPLIRHSSLDALFDWHSLALRSIFTTHDCRGLHIWEKQGIVRLLRMHRGEGRLSDVKGPLRCSQLRGARGWSSQECRQRSSVWTWPIGCMSFLKAPGQWTAAWVKHAGAWGASLQPASSRRWVCCTCSHITGSHTMLHGPNAGIVRIALLLSLKDRLQPVLSAEACPSHTVPRLCLSLQGALCICL